MVDHLGAGEERVEVGGDRLLQRHEDLVALADRQEAAEQLLRHLDAGDDLGAALGIAQQHAEAEREVGDVGEGPAEPDHQRRQRREDLLVEAGVDFARAPASLAVSSETIRIPCSSSAGRRSPSKQLCRRRSSSSTRGLDRVDLLAGGEPVGAAGVDPGVELVEQAGDPDHEELVQVGGVDRAEPDPLQQRHLGVLGQLQNPLVEVEPGELAVEIESRIVDRAIVLRHRWPPRRPQAARASSLLAPPRAAAERPADSRSASCSSARSQERSRAARTAEAPRWRRSSGEEASCRTAPAMWSASGRQSIPVWRFSISEAGPALGDRDDRQAAGAGLEHDLAVGVGPASRRGRGRRWRRRGRDPRPRASRGRSRARRGVRAARPPRGRRRPAAGAGADRRRARAGSSRRAGRRPSRGSAGPRRGPSARRGRRRGRPCSGSKREMSTPRSQRPIRAASTPRREQRAVRRRARREDHARGAVEGAERRLGHRLEAAVAAAQAGVGGELGVVAGEQRRAGDPTEQRGGDAGRARAR